MNCPKCFEPLRIADRQGIEIDYCPECRGVWLDRGELDKIIERTLGGVGRTDCREHEEQPTDYRKSRDYGHKPSKSKEYYDKKHYKHKHKKKKYKHFIEEVFDIFD